MIDRIKENRVPVLVTGISVVAFLLVAELVWGVVNAVYVRALIPALGAALTATALVLMYRTARFINFTQLGLGVVAATLFYELVTRDHMPWAAAISLALFAGVIVSVLVGVIMSLLFFKHPRLVLTVVSIVMLNLIGEIEGRITSAFIVEGERLTRPRIDGPFANIFWDLDGDRFRIAHLIGVLSIVLLSVALVMFFRKTRVGIAVRASAENADRASLLGINVKFLQVGVWALVGLMACVAKLSHIGAGGPYTPGQSSLNAREILLPLAAAILGRMKSLPVAFFAAFGLYMAQQLAIAGLDEPALIDVGIVVVLALGLIFQRKLLATRVDEGTSWRAVKEVRPVPREMLKVPGLRRVRVLLLLILGLTALAMPWIVSLDTVNTLSLVWLFALIGTSLVILTGWSGQISLGQFAMVSVGAFVASLMTNGGISFWLAAPVGGLAGAAFALLIGIPALRVRGLYLAITTLAVAAVLPTFIFDPRFLGDTVVRSGLDAPRLFFLNFEDQKSMYYLCLVVFVVVVSAVQALRRSRGGRVLIALRDNEDGVQSFGIDVVRTRLIAFGLSGFIAAFAGAFLVHLYKGMELNNFGFQSSVAIFILVVIGGIATPIGALLGALYQIGGGLWFPGVQALITGVGGLFVLMFIPGGLTQVIFGIRDAILRVIAMRRHIIVPSLFADYSPEAWEKRLAPLAPAVQSQGIGALKPDQRYRLISKVFGKAPA